MHVFRLYTAEAVMPGVKPEHDECSLPLLMPIADIRRDTVITG